MYLRNHRRRKDGKEHCYWSIAESERCSGGRVVRRHVMDLGEINDAQREAWRQAIEVFDEGAQPPRQLALFPTGQAVPAGSQALRRAGAAGSHAIASAAAMGRVLAGLPSL